MKTICLLIFLLTQGLPAADVIFNNAEAVRSSLKIDVVERHGLKQPSDEHPLFIKSLDPQLQTIPVTWTIRDPQFQVIACVATDALMLKSPSLRRSYIEYKGAIVPLRLFFNPDGSALKPAPKNPKTPDKEEFFTRGWKLPPDPLTVDALNNESSNEGTKIARRQTAEETLRSWGVFLPEGTVVYHSLSTSGTMVKSTERCLRAIESKLREHGITPVPTDD